MIDSWSVVIVESEIHEFALDCRDQERCMEKLAARYRNGRTVANASTIRSDSYYTLTESKALALRYG